MIQRKVIDMITLKIYNFAQPIDMKILKDDNVY